MEQKPKKDEQEKLRIARKLCIAEGKHFILDGRCVRCGKLLFTNKNLIEA